MALIDCPNCGKKISDKSEKCISCGYSFLNKNKKNKLLFTVFGIIVFLSIIAWIIVLIMCKDKTKKTLNNNTVDSVEEVTEPVTVTETEEITESESDIEENELENKKQIFSEISDNVMQVDEIVTDILNDMKCGSDVDYYYNVFVGAKNDLKTASTCLEDAYDLCGDIPEFSVLKTRIRVAKNSLPMSVSSNSSDAVIELLNDMEQFCYDLADVEDEMADLAREFGGNVKKKSDKKELVTDLSDKVIPWEISDILINFSEDDNYNDYYDLCNVSQIYFHFDIINGPKNEGIKILTKGYYPTGEYFENQLDGYQYVGANCWFYMEYKDNNTGRLVNFPPGKAVVDFYNAETGEYLGGKTVYVIQ